MPPQLFSQLYWSRSSCHNSYQASDTDPPGLRCRGCVGSTQWPLLCILASGEKRSSLLICDVIDRRRGRNGSISGSDLLAVQIGCCTPNVRGATVCGTAHRTFHLRLEERQTARLQVQRNFKWKVSGIFCIKRQKSRCHCLTLLHHQDIKACCMFN